MSKARKPIKKATAKTPVTRAKPVQEYRPAPFKPNVVYLSSSALLVLGFIILWGQWFKPVVKDPWQMGVELVDSAKKASDTTLRNDLYRQAQEIFHTQSTLHPYHGRVWLQKGYYHINRGELDSCIYAQKKAIEHGHGGIVNQIEYDAANMMAAALMNKVQRMPLDTNVIFAMLDTCEVEGFQNPKLLWLRGAVCNQMRDFQGGIRYLEKANAIRPQQDYDILYHLGYAYASTGQQARAREALNQAARIRPNDPAVNELLKQLNPQ